MISVRITQLHAVCQVLIPIFCVSANFNVVFLDIVLFPAIFSVFSALSKIYSFCHSSDTSLRSRLDKFPSKIKRMVHGSGTRAKIKPGRQCS